MKIISSLKIGLGAAAVCAGGLTSAFATTVESPPGTFVSGILSSKINAEQTIQDNSEWCWAASIATILKYYGCQMTQEDIVRHVFGKLADQAAGPDELAAALHDTVYVNGKALPIRAAVARNDKELVGYLEKENPVLLAYEHPQGGHAVVCTAVTYQMVNSEPHVLRLTVRDPWPNSARKQTWIMDEPPAILPEYPEASRPAEITCAPPGTILLMLAVWFDTNAPAAEKKTIEEDSQPTESKDESPSRPAPKGSPVPTNRN